MSDKIFDLEHQIMNAWNVVDDIDMLYTYFGDDPKFSGLDSKSEDEMMNLLLGMKSLYDVKFERLFKTFEAVCSEYHRRGQELEQLESQELFDNVKEHEDDMIREWQEMQDSFDYVEHEKQEREDKANRRTCSRMDIIGQNGNDGLHYKEGES